MIAERVLVPRLSGRYLPALRYLVWPFLAGAWAFRGPSRPVFLLLAAAVVFLGKGLVLLNPWDLVVLSFLGDYVGTVRPRPGPAGLWYWVNPLYAKRKLGIGGFFGTPQLKVNDLDGTPIVIAANLWYTVEDSARAVYGLEDYREFVRCQSEAGLRALAMRHPYDSSEPGARSLRGDPAASAQELQGDVQAHLGDTGLRVTDARLVHLAYAPEVAPLMLARQQADAVVAAREKMVEASVGLAEETLARLEFQPSQEERAELVVGLLTGTLSHRGVDAVVEAGGEEA